MGIIVVGSIALTILALTTLLVFVGNRMSKNLSGNKKKWWVIAHVIFVIMYFAGLLGELVMAVSTTLSNFEEHIYAAHLYILFFDNFLIIPGGFGCLITGIWIAVRTKLGIRKILLDYCKVDWEHCGYSIGFSNYWPSHPQLDSENPFP